MNISIRRYYMQVRQFFYKRMYNTRGQWTRVKLYINRSRLDLRNNLPGIVVKAESVNIFKNRLDRCEEWGI